MIGERQIIGKAEPKNILWIIESDNRISSLPNNPYILVHTETLKNKPDFGLKLNQMFSTGVRDGELKIAHSKHNIVHELQFIPSFEYNKMR